MFLSQFTFSADCLVVGDSIAVGIGQYTDCEVIAKKGINSNQLLKSLPEPMYSKKTILISIGSNDEKSKADTYLALRTRLVGTHVIWVMPIQKEDPRNFAETFKVKFGDSIIDLRNYPYEKDGVHPTAITYRKIAREIQ